MDFFESGMFVRQPAWHEKGTVLEDYPDCWEGFVASGLNWNVEKRRLVLPGNERNPNAYDADIYALVRETDDKQLGYVSDKYEMYQNEQAFRWMEPLVDSGMWKIETAGSLREGRQCWALLRQGDIEIVPNDIMKEYLLFTWSHDGGLPNIIQPTMIRVVCNNTLQSSLSKGGFTRIIHRTNMVPKMDFMQNLFTKSEDSFKTQTEIFRRLLDVTLTDGIIEKLCEEFYDADADAGERSKKIADEKVEFAKMQCFYNASGLLDLGIKNTAYGVFNALSEVNEHYFVTDRADIGNHTLQGVGFERNKRLMGRMMQFI